jgi:exosortase family protein XrtG
MQVGTIILFAALVSLWAFIVHVLRKASLAFWRFIVGAVGLFLLAMAFVRPWATLPMAQGVTAMAGLVGSLTHTFEAYFFYGIIYVPTGTSSITMQIDMECSGIIETMAFVSLLVFYPVYSRYEKVAVGILGAAILLAGNAARIVIICEIVHFFGPDAFALAHTYIGRFFFYAVTILLYFYVFTKPDVIQMKVGGLRYDAAKHS